MEHEIGQVVGPDRSTSPDPGPSEKPRLLSLPRNRILIAGGAILFVVLALLFARGPGSQVFKIYVTEPGVYRVTYEDLEEAGLKAGRLRSKGLAITHRGEEVPLWVADGDDGRFGPGDWIEFVGEQLLGHRSFHNEYTLLNVYQLALQESDSLRMSSPALPEEAARAATPAPVEIQMHLEMNNFMVHFAGPGGEAPEPRFWAKLTHIDPKPFRHDFRLERYRADSRPISLAVELRGWSTAGRGRGGADPDHRVDLYFNGNLIGSGQWDGRARHVIEVPEVPAELVKAEAVNYLELKVPRRQSSTSTDTLIDMVLLNWIEISHPAPEAQTEFGGPWIGPKQHRFVVHQPASESGPVPAKVRLTSALGAPLMVFGAGGSRFDSRNMEIEHHEETSLYHFYPPPEESVFYVAKSEEALLAPVAVELDRPSDLREPSRQADYIIIAHPRLIQAIEPLAAFHRRRGLEVAVVAVDDVYDEFNDSIVDPGAIREFLSYAYHEWQGPAPRFVLLVGDASWDAEGIGSKYNGGAPFDPEAAVSHRNLIPTSAFEEGFRGHSASDNLFVSVDGEDHLPDMAIGRFPVAQPEEVTAIVDKTIRYANEEDVGPWRRNILWLSDVSQFMQNASDGVAEAIEAKGFASIKLYPSEDEDATELSQNPLRQALDQGLLLVHFFGHGARYVWRTGATTHENNFDLFTFDDLQDLEPTAKLPLVLSMTCWSAPFDHPTADSIGEKFLRIEDRGAIAFFGASWKVSSNPDYSDLLLEELTSPGTIGEAILKAKRRLDIRGQIEKYNLLGDPAIELAFPKHQLEIAVQDRGGEGWEIVATVPTAGFAGRAIVDWLDGGGQVVHSEDLAVIDSVLIAGYRDEEEAADTVRVYVWNEKDRYDGIGARKLLSDLP